MLDQCGRLGDRIAILDVFGADTLTPDGGGDFDAVIAQFHDAVGDDDLSYGAAYFPCLYTESDEPRTSGGRRRIVPASGAMAGVYTNVDATRGVWTAPANVSIAGIVGPTVTIRVSKTRPFSLSALYSARNAVSGSDARGAAGRQPAGDERDRPEQHLALLEACTIKNTEMFRLTYIGGPTVVIEIAGVRLIIDPTLDPGGNAYPTAAYTLRKTAGPAIPRGELGRIDAVLLSHDHHSDNLDREGRALLADVPLILTTIAGAERLGARARGCAPGDTHVIDGPEGRRLRVTATPARHGPEGGDRGPVIGFLVEADGAADEGALWITGDTVWYAEAAAAVPRDVRAVIAFCGAARVTVAGPSPLTLTAEDAVALARHCGNATIVPVHYEDWQHFSEGRREIEDAFARVGLSSRLQWLERGRPTTLP